MRCAAVCRGQGPGAVLAVSDAPSWRSPVHRLVAGAVVMSATGVALEPISGAQRHVSVGPQARTGASCQQGIRTACGALPWTRANCPRPAWATASTPSRRHSALRSTAALSEGTIRCTSKKPAPLSAGSRSQAVQLADANPLVWSTSAGVVCRTALSIVCTTSSDSPAVAVGSGTVAVLGPVMVVLATEPEGWVALVVQPARLAAHSRTSGILRGIFTMMRRRHEAHGFPERVHQGAEVTTRSADGLGVCPATSFTAPGRSTAHRAARVGTALNNRSLSAD
jgi:hypothetical protein